MELKIILINVYRLNKTQHKEYPFVWMNIVFKNKEQILVAKKQAIVFKEQPKNYILKNVQLKEIFHLMVFQIVNKIPVDIIVLMDILVAQL